MRVQDEERRRIARELHDSTGQKLAAAKLHLDTILQGADGKTRDPRVGETLELVTDAFQDIRTISQLLHPPMLDEAGLESATNWLVDGFSQRSNIPVKFTVSGQIGRLNQAVELALFRVIQESLSNIHRHSHAKQAQVELSKTDGKIKLEVRDDGQGIPGNGLFGSEGDKQTLGVGILGMRERLTQLGGKLEIESGKHGTVVRAVMPARE
jgi:signal transduction histidine kinase